MQCPDCGFVLGDFDKDCMRCRKMGPPQKTCLNCGGTAGIRDEYCGWCQHRFGDPVESPAMADAYAEPAYPPQPAYAPQPLYGQSPSYPQSPPYEQQPIYVQAPPQVIVNNGSGAGWLAALMVLLLATPLGCLVIPIALICGALVLLVGWNVWPILATAAAAVAVVRASPQSVPQDKKIYFVLGILVLGLLIEAAWLQGRQR